MPIPCGRKYRFAAALAGALILWGGESAAQTVFIEDMTWPQVRARLNAGTNAVLIPTGGTEQNGPHLAIGKHNFLVYYTAGQIAKQVGNMLVAPVMPYVPEGRISPPEGHMAFPGTVSVSEQAFEALLEDVARSFRQHGFTRIYLIADHGGSAEPLARLAERLSREWKGQGISVTYIGDYYGSNGQREWVGKTTQLKAIRNPSGHAGFMDTSEMLAVRPEGVQANQIRYYDEGNYYTVGVAGDPSLAKEAYGHKLLSLKINAAVEQIQNERITR